MNLVTDSGVQYQRTQQYLRQDEMPVFHERLREVRKSRGYTQITFAEALTKYMEAHKEPGTKASVIAQSHVTSWETGKFMPKPSTLRAMSILLDVTIDYLLDLVDDPKSHLTEEGLNDQELLLVRRVRQHPELVPLLYRMLSIAPPSDKKMLGSGE